jgi:hypothetical protein
MGGGFVDAAVVSTESAVFATGIDAAAATLSVLWHIPSPAYGKPEVNKNGGGSSGDSS